MGLKFDPYLIDTLMRDLLGHDRAPSAYAVYLWLWHQTRARGRTRFGASLQTLAGETGLSKSSVQNALRRLVRRKLIVIHRRGVTSASIYEVLEPWKR